MTVRHLLDIESLETERIVQFLDTAEVFFDVSRRKIRKVPTLRGKTVINLFFEASTRTRTSFEIAGKRLSADVVNVSSSGSSVSKGETLLDTVKNLEAMRPDVLVIRHSSSGAPHFVAKHTSASVINAGDGTHEHPTQALLDAFTIRRAKGKIRELVVTIAGDITHSRVARSNVHLLTRLGATVRVCGPRTMVPQGIEQMGVSVFDDFSKAVEGADVVMMLRIQRERMGEVLFPTAREYSRRFGLGRRVLANAKPDAIVMHPGPMNRGVEIDPDVADGSQSVILDQVEAGVAVRMAALYMLAGEAGQSPLS
ncbi:MAG: aspartate carbamoyltransferase catalytic subunit [Polyangiales bacterium]